MDSNSNQSTQVSVLTERFTALLALLDEEREAITAHDGSALDVLVADKNQLCQEIAALLAEAPELTARQNVDELEEDHKRLLELAQTARDSNLVNGKILHRSQQSVREILSILSGKSLDGLYGQSGQQTAVPEPGSTAIARA